MTRAQIEIQNKKQTELFLKTLPTNYNTAKYNLTKQVAYNYGDFPPAPNANESIKHLLV